MLDIARAIDSIYRISAELGKGKPKNRYAKSSNIDISFYEPYDIDYVREKFPDAELFLVNRLGKAISKRRQYLRYRELHATKLSRGLPFRHMVDTENPDIEGTQYQQIETILSETTATTFVEGSAVGSEHSGMDNAHLGSGVLRRVRSIASVATETSYATSAGNEGRMRMPSMPPEAATGAFECPLCHKITFVSNTHSWMKHVYSDLQPYVCTFEQCNTSDHTYESRRRWFNHEIHHHRRIWTCSTHCNKEFRSRDDFERHIRHNLPTGLTTSQIPLFIDNSSAPVPQDSSNVVCPLCGDQVGGNLLLTKHLGRHLEEIALFALPQSSSDSDDNHASDLEEDDTSEHSDGPAAARGIKGTSQSSQMEEDWATFYHLDNLVNIDKKEILKQKALHEIVISEQSYLNELDLLRDMLPRMWHEKSDPPLPWPRLKKWHKLQTLTNAIRELNATALLVPARRRQDEQGPWITGFTDIFQTWATSAKALYLDYAAMFPATKFSIRREAERSLLFRQYLEMIRLDERMRRLDWLYYLKRPLTRLSRYSIHLSRLLKYEGFQSEIEKCDLEAAITEINTMTAECDSMVASATSRTILEELAEDLANPYVVELELLEPGRKILFRGYFLTTGSGLGRFKWYEHNDWIPLLLAFQYRRGLGSVYNNVAYQNSYRAFVAMNTD